MISLTRKLLLLLIVAMATGCASSPVVTTDYDRNANFAAYRTFAFAQSLGTDTAGYETLVTHTLKAATRSQMEQRGYTYTETSPDLLINFNARLDKQLQVSQTPAMPMMYYGYRGGFYSNWNGYGNEVRVDQYVEGTLNIDIVDAARKQLVWEGVAVGRVNNKQREDRQAAINAVVAEIFSKYPFRATR